MRGQFVVGVNSNGWADDFHHIVMLDYDDLPIEMVLEDALSIQRKYKLPDMLVMESSHKKYHVLCFTDLEIDELYKIMMDSKCCEKFRRCFMFNHFATLRITPKKNKITLYKRLFNNSTRRYSYESEDRYFELIKRG